MSTGELVSCEKNPDAIPISDSRLRALYSSYKMLLIGARADGTPERVERLTAVCSALGELLSLRAVVKMEGLR